MSLTEINENIINLQKRVAELDRKVTENQVAFKAHPAIFVVLMVGLFVTLDFWSTGIHGAVKKIHPRGYLYYWEYILIAGVFLIFVLWIAHQSGLHLPMFTN